MTGGAHQDDAQRGITAIQDAGENAPAILVVPSGYSAQGVKKDCVITTSSGSLGAAKKPKKQNRITKAGKMLKKGYITFSLDRPLSMAALEYPLQNVGNRVADHQKEGQKQDRGMYHRRVPVEYAVHDGIPKAGQRKDFLHDSRASQRDADPLQKARC